MENSNLDKKTVSFDEIIKNNPMPEEVKKFLDTFKALDAYEDKLRKDGREAALANVGRFREATKAYLDAVSDLLLPDCYVRSLAGYIDVLQLYRREFFRGQCEGCGFKVGMVKAFTVAPDQSQPQDQPTQEPAADTVSPAAEATETLQDIEAPAPTEAAAEEDKKNKPLRTHRAGDHSSSRTAESRIRNLDR